MADLNINPEEVINNLSSQIGNLMSENTVLKMAVGKMQVEIGNLEAQLVAAKTSVEELPKENMKKRK
jgi:regulator of replication initiation timing